MKKPLIILGIIFTIIILPVLFFRFGRFHLSEEGWRIYRKPKLNDYYAGFVINESGQPVVGASVKEHKNIGAPETVTDETGYFKLPRDKAIICSLIIEKEGFKTTTVLTHWIEWYDDKDYRPVYYSYLTSDTTKIVLQEQK